MKRALQSLLVATASLVCLCGCEQPIKKKLLEVDKRLCVEVGNKVYEYASISFWNYTSTPKCLYERSLDIYYGYTFDKDTTKYTVEVEVKEPGTKEVVEKATYINADKVYIIDI